VGGSVTISALVTNTGPRPGVEVASALCARPDRLAHPAGARAKGFQRLALAPGESQRVSFTLTEADLAFTRADGTRGVEPGSFQAWVSADCQSGSPLEFRL